MVRCSETKGDSMNWTIASVDFLSLRVRPPRSSRRRLKLHVRTKSSKPRCVLSLVTLFLASSSLKMTEDGPLSSQNLNRKREMLMFSSRFSLALTSCNIFYATWIAKQDCFFLCSLPLVLVYVNVSVHLFSYSFHGLFSAGVVCSPPQAIWSLLFNEHSSSLYWRYYSSKSNVGRLGLLLFKYCFTSALKGQL